MRLSSRNYDRLRAISNELQGPQEIDDLLLLLSFQFIEAVDDHVGFAAFALVSLDGFNQIRRASIMKEEHALPHAPERSGSKLVRTSSALCNAVGRPLPM